MASVLILKNAEVYAPLPIGRKDILCFEGKIVKVGDVNIEHFELLDVPYEIIDLDGAIIIPGLIDSHEHIIGGSGEQGYKARSTEIGIPEIIRGGITTVIGCIGVDTYTRNMPSLLAMAKNYNEEGLTAYIWSGGYDVPPMTLTGSIKTDMILVPEVIGAGEIAISDVRSSKPRLHDLARIVSDGYNGSILTGKCGVTHFHMGDGKDYLNPLFDLLNQFDIRPFSLYPTHVNRNAELLKEGCRITKSSVTIDFDVCGGDLIPSIKSFIANDGDFNFLTLSSDASFVSPDFMYQQMLDTLSYFEWPLEKILPLVTTNPARVLKLPHKGKIETGADADFAVLDPATLEIHHVIAKGKIFMRDKKMVHEPKYLNYSTRKIEIYGKKTTTG
jgi:beta-aspartyl-dipeptidase (metallo-type)